MATSAISSVLASATTATQTTSSTSNSSIDNDDFMTLMLAQLKNQDPLNPMDSNEMMGQLAQLNSLNALISMKTSLDTLNKAQTVSYATSLIGKTITAIPDSSDPTSIVSGVVTSMTTLDGVTMVQVDDQDVDVSTIVEVSEG
jgi:flagellar basal-body rod modification protein FlgD